jgi:hypothetical protein
MRFYLLLIVVLLVLAAPKAAMAFNDWYKQGFADGILYQERACTSQVQQNSALIQRENLLLWREVLRLRQALAARNAGGPSAYAVRAPQATRRPLLVQPQQIGGSED